MKLIWNILALIGLWTVCYFIIHAYVASAVEMTASVKPNECNKCIETCEIK